MTEFLKQAATVTSQYQLLAYAIAGLLLLISIIAAKKLKTSPWLLGLIVFAILFLAVSPTVAQMILAKLSQPNLYHVTVLVTKENGTPVPNPIISSDIPSGRVDNNGATQLEIAPAHLPIDKQVTIRAKDSTGALTGSKRVTLGTDLNPIFQITVARVGTILRGNIFDRRGNPLAGISVTIRGGFPDEVATTDRLGGFHFQTHLAEGETIWVVATNGNHTVQQQHIAGDDPVRIEF